MKSTTLLVLAIMLLAAVASASFARRFEDSVYAQQGPAARQAQTRFQHYNTPTAAVRSAHHANAKAAPVCPAMSVCPSGMPLCTALVLLCTADANQIGKYVSFSDFQISKGPRASGTLTLTNLVTSNAPLTFSFAFNAPDKMLTLTSQPGVVLPLATLFAGSADLKALLGDVQLRVSTIGLSLAPLGFHLGGSVTVGSAPTVNFDAVLLRASGTQKPAFGLYLDAGESPQAVFESFVASFTSRTDAMKGAFSLQSLNLLFATAGVQNLPESLTPMATGPSMAQGLSVKAQGALNVNARCAWMRTLAKLVSGTYMLDLEVPPAPTAASLTVGLPDVHVGGAAVLAPNVLAIQFPRAKQAASARLTTTLRGVTAGGQALPPFAALAELDFGIMTTLTLQLQMAGTVDKAFGIDRLSLSNVAGSMTLTEVSPFLVGGSLGATVVLGDLSVEGRFGINAQDARKNYVYTKLANGLTLDSFLRAFFGRTFALPASLLSTGFQPGTTFSVAATAIKDDFFSPPVDVPQGVHFSGGVELFGVGPFTLDVVLQSQPTPLFSIDVVMPVFHIGTCAIRGDTDSADGPRLQVSSAQLDINLAASIECPEFSVAGTLALQAEPEKFALSAQGVALSKSLTVALTASAAVGAPFDFSATVDLNVATFWTKVKAYTALKTVVDAIPLISKCPDSSIARKLGITKLCESVLGPMLALKAWIDNPVLDTKLTVVGQLGAGQVNFDVKWDFQIASKHITGEAVICIEGTCVHDRVSQELGVLNQVHQAWTAAWDKIKKLL